jgi:hypothetical protein
MIQVYSPTGWSIQGTAEEIPAIGKVNFLLEEEELEWANNGSTDVRWDEQRSIRDEEGNVLFVDHAGEKWTRDELVVNPDVAGVHVVDSNGNDHAAQYHFGDLSSAMPNRRNIQSHARKDLGLKQPNKPWDDPQREWTIQVMNQENQ